MTAIKYLAVPGSDHIYEVYAGAEAIGIVWRTSGAWYASRRSTSDRSITASTMEEAAICLLDVTSAPRP